jgi:hypothetical protein
MSNRRDAASRWTSPVERRRRSTCSRGASPAPPTTLCRAVDRRRGCRQRRRPIVLLVLPMHSFCRPRSLSTARLSTELVIHWISGQFLIVANIHRVIHAEIDARCLHCLQHRRGDLRLSPCASVTFGRSATPSTTATMAGRRSGAARPTRCRYLSTPGQARRNASTASTRRWSSGAGARRSLSRMDVTCFSTARSVMTS